MRLRSLVWKELLHRPTPLATSLLAVLLAVSALVAVQTITESSEREVARRLDELGANILILPSTVSLQDYYAADMHGETLPEEFVTRLALERMVGVQNLAPKLCVKTDLNGRQTVLTGILPRAEFRKKVAWQSVGLLTSALNPVGREHQGCKGDSCSTASGPADLESFVTSRVIEELPLDVAIVGTDIAKQHGLETGDVVELMGEQFQVAAVLPATGTVDDGRVFVHLHSVQRLADTGPVVNVIEIVGCCEDAASGLVGELRRALPETKVVTISQIVQTQVTVNQLMGRMSYVFFGILILVGGAGIASVMYANVAERRRELGTLMALGAAPSWLIRMILLKALALGLAGGLGGMIVGTVSALLLGPGLLGIAVDPVLQPGLVGLATALIVAVTASCLPARKAAKLDPCVCFQEV